MNIYFRLIRYSKPYLRYFITAVLCMLVLAGATGAIAYLVEPAVNEIFQKKDFTMLYLVPFALMLLYLVKGLAEFGQAYLIGYVGNRVMLDLQNAIYRHAQTLSLSFFTANSTGMLLSRIGNDVAIVQRTVSSSVMNVLKNFFMMIALTGVAFYQNWQMMLFCTLFFPGLVLMVVKLGKKSRKYSRKEQERMGSVTTFLDETISGNQTVKAFCMEDYEVNRFSHETERLLNVNLKSIKVDIISTPLMRIFGGLLVSGIIYYGGYQVINDQMSSGKFFSFVAALAMLYKPIKSFAKETVAIQRGVAAAIRVFELLDIVPDIKDAPGAKVLPGIERAIEFRDVSFQYEDTPVLKRINFTVNKGEILAIVGHSGVGKSTIANLLLRFYDVTEGGIYIDGTDIREAQIKSLRDQIAFVTQETLLFNDTIRNNIAYGGKDISEEKIVAAARAAYIHDFIVSLPEGYDTVTGEKGVRLSGGQCQRIAIARAIVKDAPILILDEATSSLDSHSEAQVQKALEKLMENRTSLLIAHRLSTVRNAHKIIVMANGEIVEEGSHQDLLGHRGVYNTLVKIQSGYDKSQKGGAQSAAAEGD